MQDNKEDNLIFQISDWDEHHQEDDDEKKHFIIRLFGKTKKQESVYLEIIDFKPYFYVEIKNNWNLLQINSFMEEVKKNVYAFTGKDLSPEEKMEKNNILKEGLIKYQPVKKCRFYGFTNYSQFTFLQLNFENMQSFRAYERAFRKYYSIPKISKKSFKVKIYESNLPAMFRFMHIQKLNAVGWISIRRNKLSEDTFSTTCCDINYQTKWTNVEYVEDQLIEKFTIMSFDIECTSKDGSFPQPDRVEDKIIQIGMTLSRFGEAECYEKHLVSLGETADIDGVNVQWYEKEEDLLLGFTKLMRKINPDIITGYNIFGFDWKYIKRRVDKLKSMMDEEGREKEGRKFLNSFSKLSRINNDISEWTEKTLASSALGENLLYYYKTTGRVQVDLMKVVQKDYKLSSYKLDNVASNFIRENILSLENMKDGTFKISSRSTFGLGNNDYITVGYFDGAVEEKYETGKKFKIIELTKNSIIAKGQVDTSDFMGKGYKVYWSQAKDDITPQDIFRMCKGTPEERAIVGKYCIKDCELCNTLIAKLQIITNNIGMANVCHVPLSFLFLRGQGIKIFSLVAKKCREQNHLIPVLKKKFKIDDKDKNKNKNKNKNQNQNQNQSSFLIKKKNFEDDKGDDALEKHIRELNMKGREEEDDDDDGYEGAIVFAPEPKVWYEPIYVLDFASLYPNSMILRNLSHECYVDDPAYDNLPGYKYHTITYKNNKGELITCRFAEQRGGKKGIIPQILIDLLTARKRYKKLMGNETDVFKKSIMDGLQLAYKVTANSLYGQTGASTSSIFMKEIAASTTATGREAVQYAKYFIEEFFSPIVGYALNNKKEFMKRMKELYQYYPTSYDTVHPDGYDITIHVNTDENEEICDEKYVCPTVGYEIKYEIPEEIALNWKLVFTQLYELEPILRTKFKKYLQDYIDDEGNVTAKDIYNEFKNIWGKLEINSYKELKKVLLKKLDSASEEIQKSFFDNLGIAIEDIGYKNKEHFFEKVYESMNNIMNGFTTDNKIIYGDTDSIFCCAHIRNNETDEIMTDKKSLIQSIGLGVWSSLMIDILLPAPMKLAYEKVLWPFVIQGKKRYVGNLYEKNPDKFVQKSMGIELKRRDNAPIVKTVSAGIITKIVNERDPEGAFEFMRDILEKVIHGHFNMDKFIITKTLRGNALTKDERIIEAKKPREKRSYSERTSIVHAVLADRMADRDPGNKPMSNDRIPYAYIETKIEPKLQGERVENPEYIVENNLKLDTLFYITNQIMKPALKFLNLITENADDLFKDYIAREENRRRGMMPLSYYGEKNADDISDNDYFDNCEIKDNNKKTKKTKKTQKTSKKKEREVKITENSDSLLVDF